MMLYSFTTAPPGEVGRRAPPSRGRQQEIALPIAAAARRSSLLTCSSSCAPTRTLRSCPTPPSLARALSRSRSIAPPRGRRGRQSRGYHVRARKMDAVREERATARPTRRSPSSLSSSATSRRCRSQRPCTPSCRVRCTSCSSWARGCRCPPTRARACVVPRVRPPSAPSGTAGASGVLRLRGAHGAARAAVRRAARRDHRAMVRRRTRTRTGSADPARARGAAAAARGGRPTAGTCAAALTRAAACGCASFCRFLTEKRSESAAVAPGRRDASRGAPVASPTREGPRRPAAPARARQPADASATFAVAAAVEVAASEDAGDVAGSTLTGGWPSGASLELDDPRSGRRRAGSLQTSSARMNGFRAGGGGRGEPSWSALHARAQSRRGGGTRRRGAAVEFVAWSKTPSPSQRRRDHVVAKNSRAPDRRAPSASPAPRRHGGHGRGSPAQPDVGAEVYATRRGRGGPAAGVVGGIAAAGSPKRGSSCTSLRGADGGREQQLRAPRAGVSSHLGEGDSDVRHVETLGESTEPSRACYEDGVASRSRRGGVKGEHRRLPSIQRGRVDLAARARTRRSVAG